MAFSIHTTDDGRVPGLEYLPCGAVVPKAGMAMKLQNGKLAAAKGAELPLYLSMAERKEACENGELIPVIRISSDMVFETATPQGFAAVPGDRVQLSADGLDLAAEQGGAAEVAYADDSAVRIRFVQYGAGVPAQPAGE